MAEAVAIASTWNARVAAIRTIPERFGTAQHAVVYAAIAERVYMPTLKPDFAYVHWREDYEFEPFRVAYETAREGTGGFTQVGRDDLARLVADHPETLRVFRLILGFTMSEFAQTCALVAATFRMPTPSPSRLGSMEDGRHASADVARTCAIVVDLVMNRDSSLFPSPPPGSTLRLKIEKSDTTEGWTTVRRYATEGLPLSVLLHQRAYGGAFRQLLDATSSQRGDLVEEAVAAMFRHEGIPYLRTGSHNQAVIKTRFGLTVRPAPDFVMYDRHTDTLKAILECKAANDGGTARDKAARFRTLRAEAQRLGGVPVFAVLAGIGWRRTMDALGPVVRDTDGRTFTLATLDDMMSTEPLPGLRASI